MTLAARITGPLILAAIAQSAHGSDRYSFGDGRSDVSIHPTTRPGALAEIRFQNRSTDADTMAGAFTLTLDGLTVDVTGIVGRGAEPDEIRVTPPEGIMCAPSCTLVIPDGSNGVVWLYSTEGVGA